MHRTRIFLFLFSEYNSSFALCCCKPIKLCFDFSNEEERELRPAADANMPYGAAFEYLKSRRNLLLCLKFLVKFCFQTNI